jgi:hypothetical protein
MLTVLRDASSPFMRGGVLFTTRTVYINDIDERWFYRVDGIKYEQQGDEWTWAVSVDAWSSDDRHTPFTTYNKYKEDYIARGHLDDYLYRIDEHVAQFVIDYKTNMEMVGQ